MKKYHKINTIFKRDPDNKYKIIEGDYSRDVFRFLKDSEWVFTEKVDGTNIRIMWDGEKVRIGGKSDNAQIPSFLLDRLESYFRTDSALNVFTEKFGPDTCLYGEGFGPKIQKGGGNYGDQVDFVLFDVKVGEWWLERENVENIASVFDIPVVPIIGRGDFSDATEMCRKGFNSTWGDFEAEGIVMRPSVELMSRNGNRIIAKLKCTDFE